MCRRAGFTRRVGGFFSRLMLTSGMARTFHRSELELVSTEEREAES